jgi:hypothetical protein
MTWLGERLAVLTAREFLWRLLKTIRTEVLKTFQGRCTASFADKDFKASAWSSGWGWI